MQKITSILTAAVIALMTQNAMAELNMAFSAKCSGMGGTITTEDENTCFFSTETDKLLEEHDAELDAKIEEVRKELYKEMLEKMEIVRKEKTDLAENLCEEFSYLGEVQVNDLGLIGADSVVCAIE